MKRTSTLKALILGTAATTLFAAEAFAQANHNTSRSNKRAGGIATPADTSTQVGAEVDDAKVGPTENQGHVTLIKSAKGNDSGKKPELTECVTEAGAVDTNCDGVADADQDNMNKDTRFDRKDIRKRPAPRQQRR